MEPPAQPLPSEVSPTIRNRGSRNRRGLVAAGLIAIVAGALALRIWGIGWGLPYAYQADEPVNLTTTLRMIQERDPNPRFFNYPPFFYYVEAGGQLAYVGVGMASGSFSSVSDVSLPEMQTLANGRLANPNSLLTGRVISVAFSVAAVALVFGLVWGVSRNAIGATVAGSLMALTPLAVRRGRLMTPDPMAAFFAAAVLAAAMLVLRRGRRVDYVVAGIAVGLGASSKYHLAIVAVVVLAAHVMRTGRSFWKAPDLYLAGVVSIVTFLFTSPFVLLDARSFWSELTFKSEIYSGGVGGDLDSVRFYLDTFIREYGAVLVLVPFAFVKRYRREATLALLMVVAYVVFIAIFVLRFDRHLLPVLPAMATLVGFGAAAAATALKQWLATRSGIWRYPGWASALVVVGVALALVVGPVRETIDDTRWYASDERSGVRAWIDANVPDASAVLVDAYSPFVDPVRFNAIPTTFVVDFDGDPASVDFVLVAGQGSGRFLDSPDRYPVQVDGFDDRFGGFCEVARFAGPPWHAVLARDCPDDPAS